MQISEDDNQDLNVFIEDLNVLSQPTNHIYKWFKSDFSWLLNIVDENDHFITYDGSLTTSPYKECVKWILLTKVHNISKNQVSNVEKFVDSILYLYVMRSKRKYNRRRPIFVHLLQIKYYYYDIITSFLGIMFGNKFRR